MAAALVAGALGTTAGVAQAAPQQDDFTGGTPQGTAVVAGGVELKPAFDETFAQLPTALITPWPGATETSTANGTLDLNHALMNSGVVAGVGSSISFRATFNQDNQHIGYAEGFNSNVWAIFSYKEGTNVVSARTQNGTVFEETPLPGLAGSPHDYRIDRTAAGFKYYVDGNPVPVAEDADTITTQLYAQASDLVAPGMPLKIEAMSLRNATQGTFESRAFDAGDSRVSGITFTPESATPAPAGTNITYKTSTSADGLNWTTFSSGAIQPARYFKYLATLSSSTADPALTPRLTKATVDFQIAPAPQPGPGTQPPSGGNTGGDTKKPKLGMPRDADVSKRGKVRLLLTCPDDETRCNVALKFKWNGNTVASKSGKIDGGDSRYISLKLSKAAKKKLAKAGKLKVVATLTVTDAAGNKRTSSKSIWLYSL